MPPSRALLWFAFLAGSAIATWLWWLWLERSGRATPARQFLPFVVAGLAALMVFTFRSPMNDDDVAHVHVAWRMAQGDLPYRDFWEHHAPAMWLLLVPLMKLLPPTPAICEISRVVALACTGLAVWGAIRLGREGEPEDRSSLPLALLVVGAAGSAFQVSYLRPDLGGIALSMFGLMLAARAVAGCRRAAIGAGLCLGAALTFTPKLWPLLPVLPLCLVLHRRPPGKLVEITTLYALGGLGGVAPVAGWLLGRGIGADAFFWVLTFNRSLMGEFEGRFPAVLGILGLLGAAAAWRDERRQERPALTVAVVAWAFIALGFMAAPHRIAYGLLPWALLTAVLLAWQWPRLHSAISSAADADKVGERRRGLALATGAVSALLLAPALADAAYFARNDGFTPSRAAIAWLQRESQGGTVVAVPPMHPIFARSAIDLWQANQYAFFTSMPPVRDRLSKTSQTLQSGLPSLVEVAPWRQTTGMDLLPWLERNGVVTEPERRAIEETLRTRYTRVSHNGAEFWIRHAEQDGAGARVSR